jgi:hypothetical protein
VQPTALQWLIDLKKSLKYLTKPNASDSGMAIIKISDALVHNGKSVISTKPMAIIKSIPNPESLCATLSAWSKLPVLSLICFYYVFFVAK